MKGFLNNGRMSNGSPVMYGAASGAYTTGTVSASGNITYGNIVYPSGSASLSFVFGNVYALKGTDGDMSYKLQDGDYAN